MKLRIENGSLRCHAPKNLLTPILRDQIAERKTEIIEFLQRVDFASSSSNKQILTVPRDKELPLSFAQQRLWFLQQLEPDNPFYNEYGAIQLTGILNVAALEQSLNEIVQRHEALRTTFKMLDGETFQTIAPSLILTLPVVDLCQLPEAEQEMEVQRLATDQNQGPFDLVQDSLLRWTLVQLSEQKHVLLFTIHHIVYDGWSAGVIIRELSALYETFSSGKPVSLPELPIQYADFAVWQRQELQGAKLESQLSYWKQQLNNAPPLLQLPTDRPRPPVQTYRGAKESFELPKSLTKALQAIGRKAEATLFMTLLAAFKVLFYRYSGQEDIIIGSPIANRNRAEIEGLIGCFVNTLVLRTDCSGNPTFEELLGRVRQVTMKAYEHQDLPFEKLVEELQPERDANYNPLFQVLFNLQNTPEVKLELPELTLTPFEVEHTRTLFDLRLDMTEIDSGLEGFWEYNTDLFDAARINRMMGHFQKLLEVIAANPQQRVDQLPLLSQSERHQLLTEWNDTAREYASDTCIHQLFEEQVEKTPDAVAVVFENQQLTYQQLNQRANQLAHHLQSLGVKPEVLVGICVERSLEMVVGLLGILKAGGAYVPPDPNYPQERLSYMLADSGVEVLLTQQSLLEYLPPSQAQVVCLDTDWGVIEQHPQKNLEVGICSDNLAYVIYTSGSTGKPKGVQICHQSVVNFLNSMSHVLGLTQEDTFCAVTTISFDIAALDLYLPLTVGAKVIVASRGVATDSERLLSELFSSKISVMQATPATWQMLLDAGWSSNYPLKVLCGGEALSAQLAHQILETGSQLWNLYGPTEATIWSTIYQVGANKTVAVNQGVPPYIGRPIANTQIYILDKNLQPLPIGVPGELYIGGNGLARGYLNRPELTQEKFIPNPFNNSKFKTQKSKLYKTGDLARYLPDGNIEFLGRIDNQVKIRGFRIELGEIEAVLNQHSQVREAVVVAREDQAGDKRLVAYVVPHSEISIATSNLRDLLQQKLPNYMIPSAFVILEALPLTPNGKVNRKALPAPDISRSDVGFVPPRNPTEEVLAAIYADILGLEKVSIHDNFFELGGHSLLATKVISRLREAFEIDLPLRSLFERPTVAGFSTRIETMRLALTQVSPPPVAAGKGRKEIEL
ncbi:MAG: amino acid adenylation domain-containing protein [Symploca sp. SIO2E9]|nr:amino acid adenylation domain-containing protein [Symploca sp. SIO2E9]